MRQGEVLYTRGDGAMLKYESGEGVDAQGFVEDATGRVFPVQPMGSILARGYWQPVVSHGSISAIKTIAEAFIAKYSPDQPRDEQGRFTDSASSVATPQTEGHWDVRQRVMPGDVIPVVDSSRGLDLLNQGKFIEADVQTVTAMVQEAAQSHSNADITNIQITGTDLMTQNNVGIPRNMMPQVDPENKAQWLADTQKQGIAVTEDTVDPADLKPIQSEINAGKVGAMYQAIQDGSLDIHSGNMADRIIVSQDGYVLDGHHRWAAAALTSMTTDGGIKIPAYTVHTDYKSALNQMLTWDKNNNVALQNLGGQAVKSIAKMFLAKYDPDQPRDEQGRFASTGDVAPSTTSIAEAAISGGFSVNGVTGKYPQTGYMVARVGGHLEFNAPTVEDTAKAITEFMNTHADTFANEPNLYFGGWRNDEGKLYLELSDNVASRDVAVQLGQARDQEGIWDVSNSEVIGTGGTGGQRAKAGFDGNPDTIYGEGTVVRATTKGLGLVDRGTETIVGDAPRGNFPQKVIAERFIGKYSPDQERDDHGRFASDGESSSSLTPKDIARESNKIRREFPSSALLGQDVKLKALINAKGFNGLPKLVKSADELTGTKIFRGLSQGDGKNDLVDKYIQDLKTGDFFVGMGYVGNGTYFSDNPDTALNYARQNSDNVIQASLSPDAKILDVMAQHDSIMSEVPDGLKGSVVGGDPSHVSVAAGYDALKVTLPSGNEHYYVVFNRTKLQVVDK